MRKLIITCVCLFALTGCTFKMFDFTIISTEKIEVEKLSKAYVMDKKIKGNDLSQIIIIIPVGQNKVDKAVRNAILSLKGCIALMNGSVYSKFFLYPVYLR